MPAQPWRTRTRPLTVGAVTLASAFVLSSCGIAQQLAGQEPGGGTPDPTPADSPDRTEETRDDPDPQDEPEPDGTDEEFVDVMDIEEGQCINHESMAEGEVSVMPVVPCSEPHDGEVFAIEELESDRDYPGEADIQQEASDLCTGDAFEDFVGVPWGASIYWTTEWWPTAEGWDMGDHEVICVIYDDDGQTVGSLEGVEE
ncbi:septum formation family protein [Lipingzhangella sp. LS1_29]|uniref:Septum formation family protein n=1 Tax=Lipingzhangella rawalii TaxID=2055835 RepID=A0ABU2H8E8_9ACTN|nr:septum formation family protein [Lipingzhangella rawalii]MDS1271572.1 septum formation family protein [Lipingzhangella rawalii]